MLKDALHSATYANRILSPSLTIDEFQQMYSLDSQLRKFVLYQACNVL